MKKKKDKKIDPTRKWLDKVKDEAEKEEEKKKNEEVNNFEEFFTTNEEYRPKGFRLNIPVDDSLLQNILNDICDRLESLEKGK